MAKKLPHQKLDTRDGQLVVVFKRSDPNVQRFSHIADTLQEHWTIGPAGNRGLQRVGRWLALENRVPANQAFS